MKKNKKSFLKQLAVGSKAEELVCATLNDANIRCSLDKTSLIKWDIIGEIKRRNKDRTIKTNEVTVEVKYDEYENRSGNIAIEVFNTRLNKPSGIMATKAYFWAHVLKNGEIYLTTTKKLKEYARRRKPHRVIASGGDNNAKLYLYRSEKILNDIFTRIDDIGIDKLRKIVGDSYV